MDERVRRGLGIAGLLALLIATGLGAWVLKSTTSAETDCWETVDISPGAGPHLVRVNAIVAPPSGEVWLVGDAEDGAVAMRFDGATWKALPVPKPEGMETTLAAITVISPEDAWAAGTRYARDYSSASETHILHWDGSTWSVVASPNPGADGNSLAAISAIAPDDIWAVGATTPARSSLQPLLLHWDGQNWAERPAAILKGANAVADAVAFAPDDIWAVGQGGSNYNPLTLHWDGSRWSVAPTGPGPFESGRFDAIAATGPDDIWAVGHTPHIKSWTTLTMSWDGSKWTEVPSPNQGSQTPIHVKAQLADVGAVAPDDVWAVGSWGDSCCPESSYERPFVLHWDGAEWNVDVQDLPAIRKGNGRMELTAVAARPGEVWAAGMYYGEGEPQRAVVVQLAAPCENAPLSYNWRTLGAVSAPGN